MCMMKNSGEKEACEVANNLAKGLSPLGLLVNDLLLDEVHSFADIMAEVVDGDGERLEAVIQRRFHLVHSRLYLRHAPVERGKIIRHLAGFLLAAVLHHAHRCLTSF